jgi:hypothetical protein
MYLILFAIFEVPEIKLETENRLVPNSEGPIFRDG